MITTDGSVFTFEEYAALWGCDPTYDRAPRNFLRKFLPAISRTIKGASGDDVEGLDELRVEVKRRLRLAEKRQ